MKPRIVLHFTALFLMASATMTQAQVWTAHDSLTINNIGARINVLGDNFDNLGDSTRGFSAPINTNLSTIFASTLWIGGYQKGNLKVAAMTYRQTGIDFFPGPLDTINDTTTTAEMNYWNRVWKVQRSEVNDFKANHTIYTSIAKWPGNGHDSVESHFMAPFVDVNQDGIYNPADGDYPDIKGDEAIWWVMNDNGGVHSQSKGKAMGIEARGEAYAFDMPSNDAINNTIYVDYQIINRSKTEIDSMYFGLWTDFDIGYPFDDYIGSAPSLSAFYGYNGEPVDPYYGANTPVESVIFMKDSMSRFLYYNNTADPVTGNPGFPNPNAKDYYNYLKGVWKNGACMKYGSKDGVSGTQCTDFMFDGSPADTISGWTEHNVGNTPGDRRGIGAVGPITLKPGETYELPLAYVFARIPNGNTARNFQATEQYWTQVKNFYNSNYTSTGINNPGQPVNAIGIFPNPAMDKVYVQTANEGLQKIVIIDMMGKTVYLNANTGQANKIAIDISRLSAGVYTVIAGTKNGTSSQKLIVAR